jgi:Ca2+-binding RTX toxin-like protein
VSVNEAYPGFYEIQGDNQSNVIDVAVSMTDDSFSLNGVTYHDVSYISVSSGGGDDIINILSVDGPGMIGAGISAGPGNDNITLNFDGAVWAGSGNDVLNLMDSFRGEAYGEAGNDQIFIMGACVDAEIQGGDGNDLIDCSNNLYSVVIHGGSGSDTLYGSDHDDQLYGDDGEDYIYGRDGNDEIYWATNDHVDGGNGHDILYYSNPSSVINVEEVVS